MIKLFLSVILFVSLNVSAEELDKASQEALEKTVEVLKDPKKQKDNKKLDSLGLSAAQKKEVYGLSAEIFEQIVKETGGDATKMKKILEDAMKDPESFAKRWTPEQKAKLKGLSSEVEKSGKKVKKP